MLLLHVHMFTFVTNTNLNWRKNTTWPGHTAIYVLLKRHQSCLKKITIEEFNNANQSMEHSIRWISDDTGSLSCFNYDVSRASCQTSLFIHTAIRVYLRYQVTKMWRTLDQTINTRRKQINYWCLHCMYHDTHHVPQMNTNIYINV